MTLSYRRANALMLLVAANPRTPHQVLNELAREEDPQLLEQVAENENTHPSTLLYLATHPMADVRIAVSQNPKLPSEIAWILKNDEHPDVKYALASNPLISLDALIALREDENPYVSSRAGQSIERICAERRLVAQQSTTLVDITRRAWRKQVAETAV